MWLIATYGQRRASDQKLWISPILRDMFEFFKNILWEDHLSYALNINVSKLAWWDGLHLVSVNCTFEGMRWTVNVYQDGQNTSDNWECFCRTNNAYSFSQIITSVSMWNDYLCNFMDGRTVSSSMNWLMICFNGKLTCAKTTYLFIRKLNHPFTPNGVDVYWRKWLAPPSCCPKGNSRQIRKVFVCGKNVVANGPGNVSNWNSGNLGTYS